MRGYFSSISRLIGLIGLGPALFVLFFLWSSDDSNSPVSFTVLEDSGQTINEAWNTEFKHPPREARFNPGIRSHGWWVKTEFKNESTQEGDFYLILNNPHINLIRGYVNQETEESLLTGDRFPFSSRPYPYRDFAIPFELEAGGSIQILLLLEKKGETFHIEPEILNEEEFIKRQNSENLIIGLIIGWMSLIISFIFFFWLEMRSKSALFYTLFLLVSLFWIISNWGLGFQYLWPESVTWVGKSRPVFNLTSNVFFLLTILNFFPPLPYQKKISRFIQIQIWINFILLLAFLIIPESTVNPGTISFFLRMVFVLSMIELGSMVSYLIAHLKEKTPNVDLYLAGISFLLILSITIYIDQATGWFHLSHTLLYFGSAFGHMGETLLITIAFVRFASQQKKEKDNLAIQMFEKEKESSDKVILAQEQERNRIGRDLHDGVLGFLGTIHLKFQSVLEKNPDPNLLELKNELGEAIKETREISHDLTPPLLEEFGLERAIQNQLIKLQENGKIKTAFFSAIDFPLDKALEITIYRIFLELVQNIVKHAFAQELQVYIETRDGILQLMVEDDGVGFNPDQTLKGIGLKNVRNRVEYLKGTIQIDSNSSGTSVLIFVPLF